MYGYIMNFSRPIGRSLRANCLAAPPSLWHIPRRAGACPCRISAPCFRAMLVKWSCVGAPTKRQGQAPALRWRGSPPAGPPHQRRPLFQNAPKGYAERHNRHSRSVCCACWLSYAYCPVPRTLLYIRFTWCRRFCHLRRPNRGRCSRAHSGSRPERRCRFPRRGGLPAPLQCPRGPR